jgi:hypothetical protein
MRFADFSCGLSFSTRKSAGVRMAYWTRSIHSYLACLVALSAVVCLPLSPASAADGVWKERTEVVWNKETHALIRKSFRVWDLHPELDLDFLWEPRAEVSSDRTDSIANGAGTLSWHVKGSADYDRQFTYSVFKGELNDGRPNGQGSMVILHTGYSYTGQWSDGKMSGHGVLRFSSGDKYEGDFVAGEMQGTGKYTSTDGSVYVGEFRDGMRDGAGILMLADGSYRTAWLAGREVERHLIAGSAPSSPRLLLAALSNTVKLKLSLDEDKNPIVSTNVASDTEVHAYEADYSPNSISIHLGDKAMVNAWMNNGEISTGKEDNLQYLSDQPDFSAVYMGAVIENEGTSATAVTDAYLAVTESITNLSPYLELSRSDYQDCMPNDAYAPDLILSNFGWGPLSNAQLKYSLGTGDNRSSPVTLQLGTFDSTKALSIADTLKNMGVDTDRLKKAATETYQRSQADHPKPPRYSFQCEAPDPDQSEGQYQKVLAACVARVEQSGVLGRLKDFVFASENVIYTTMAGSIQDHWTGSDGTANSSDSPFSINIPLIAFAIELGEGGCQDAGDYTPHSKPAPKSTMLSLDRHDYKIQLPKNWNAKLTQGTSITIPLALSAAKSSGHKFQLVLQLADGSQVLSPMVDLSYFRQRNAKR